jgi:hypothetical protein
MSVGMSESSFKLREDWPTSLEVILCKNAIASSIGATIVKLSHEEVVLLVGSKACGNVH